MNAAKEPGVSPAEGLATKGLTASEAARRLSQHGPNEIRHEEPTSALRLFLGQLSSPVVWLLLGACVVSGLLGEAVDAIAIGSIVVLNAAVGFFQEFRAERALLALRAMTAPRARVVRDGRAAVIPAAEVVPGDVLLLEAGDVVAADAQLTVAHALSCNEAALTGESLPVEKSTAPSAPNAPLAERSDFVFLGTAIATGSAEAQVRATGMGTELGKIAHLLTTAQETQTPLQQRLAKVSRTLLYLCLGVVAVVAGLGLFRGQPPFTVFMSAVSLAVAAVPEGLPAVVTIALAIGVQRMAARNVLIRKMHAVETLGSATVVCTDKTGTLTTGVMAVREVWGEDEGQVLQAAAACCDAELSADGRGGVGDPTEVALLVAAAERGIRKEELEARLPRVQVNPFDSTRKRMSILRADGVLYVKGAVELLLPLCAEGTQGALAANAQLAARGLRVLAVAVGKGPQEEQLRLLGLLGLADPPRPEAIDAVAAARAAGVKTVMITGDHPDTAKAIAGELGILLAGDQPQDLVHARATPEDKLRIVREWKGKGAVVAMTGDGVNDAPALREAHIGIAMGKTGTEVTREASDMVLTDDNFASVVAAIREGRGIFDNIRKTLVYLLIGNAGELTVMLAASLVGLPLPFLPLHLLWINLVTDGLPALALVMDPPAPDVLERPPRPPQEPMLGWPEWRLILVVGALEAGVVFSAYAWAMREGDVAYARSVAFAVLVFSQLFRAFGTRSLTRIYWEVGPFTNLKLLAVIALSVGIQAGLYLLPATRALFDLRLLPLEGWAVALGLGLVVVTLLELRKLGRRLLARQAL